MFIGKVKGLLRFELLLFRDKSVFRLNGKIVHTDFGGIREGDWECFFPNYL